MQPETTHDDGPIFHIEPLGALGNQMIEYMVALKFASLVPGCRISNVHLPEWNIHHPPIAGDGPVAYERLQQHIDLPRLARAVHAGELRRVEWSGYGQRLENFLPREQYLDVFTPPFRDNVGYGAGYLVCHVRTGGMLDSTAGDYPLTPVEFFEDLVRETGLKPVFIGQTDANPYTLRLRERFRFAEFRDTQDIIVDFETIRQSRNVVVGVSTFAWLAAWLSRMDNNIFMSVNGLFNPMQTPVVDLLPFGDSRYRFYQFPVNYAVAVEHHADMHRKLAPYWRFVTHDMLQRQITEAPRFERTLDMMVSAFDERYYLAENGDVRAVVEAGGFAAGLDHYMRHGFKERRFPFHLDSRWYAASYPMAAFEVAQGDYTDFTHHYLAVGRARGYRPVPD